MKANPKRQYTQQKAGAKRRGIEFLLTFEQWLEWWGNDLERRGTGEFDLQMCRKLDAGPYSLENIYKGTASENHRTAANLKLVRASERKKRELQARLDAMMWAESAPAKDEIYTTDEMDFLRTTGVISDRRHCNFAADKRR